MGRIEQNEEEEWERRRRVLNGEESFHCKKKKYNGREGEGKKVK